MAAHLINWFGETIKRDIINTTQLNVSAPEPSTGKTKTRPTQDPIIRDNLITTSNLSSLITQLHDVIRNWNSPIPQKLDKKRKRTMSFNSNPS